jgi:hypothetical protein
LTSSATTAPSGADRLLQRLWPSASPLLRPRRQRLLQFGNWQRSDVC